MRYYHRNPYTDPEAYVYDADLICEDCFRTLGPQEQRAAIPQPDLHEWEDEEGEGVRCWWCNAWIQEPTPAYLFRKACAEQRIVGLRVAYGDHEVECLTCAVKMHDFEPEHERLTAEQAGRLTYWDCEQPLVV